MDPILNLLSVMSSEHSGISDYWRNKLKNILAQVPQEPLNMVEIVLDEPTVANEVIAAD